MVANLFGRINKSAAALLATRVHAEPANKQKTRMLSAVGPGTGSFFDDCANEKQCCA